MSNRRKFLQDLRHLLLSGFGFGVAGCTVSARRDAATGEQLLREIEHIRSQDYGEIGVPMVLVGENLQRPVARSRDLGGLRLAATLEDYTQSMLAVRPDAAPGEVAAIVELIGSKDFESGGREFPS